jgi:hypothetical protein
MVRVARKNLMVDPEALGELARRRGTSESLAAREAIAAALAAEDMVAALRGLHALDAFADFEQVLDLEPNIDATGPSRA